MQTFNSKIVGLSLGRGTKRFLTSNRSVKPPMKKVLSLPRAATGRTSAGLCIILNVLSIPDMRESEVKKKKGNFVTETKKSINLNK